jgi:hypothetical protein
MGSDRVKLTKCGETQMIAEAVQTNIAAGTARLYLTARNAEIIRSAARRRQAHGMGDGERLPAGIARAPVSLQELHERQPGRRVERVTAAGHKTAVQALPRILAALHRDDPRRRAADLLATSFERIGAAGGGGAEGGDTKGGQSDGGVTTRIKHAQRLRVIEAVANRWAISQGHGVVTPGADRVVLAVRRKRGNRQQIKAFPLLVALCVEGHDLAQILTAHGWTVHSKHSRPLGVAALGLLDDIADALGFGRGGPATRA